MDEGYVDILDEIKNNETKEDNSFDAYQTFLLLILNWAMMFGLGYVGNPETYYMGFSILMLSLIGMPAIWVGPSVKAGYVARSRVYLKVMGYFGKYFFPFQMELIDYPKVVAKEYEDGEIESIDYDEYNTLFDALKITNLDGDIDDLIRGAHMKRLDFHYDKEQNKQRGYKRVWKRVRKQK